MKRGNPPPGSLPYSLQKVSRDLLSTISHRQGITPQPLMTLLGAEGDRVKEQVIKTQRFFATPRPIVDPALTLY